MAIYWHSIKVFLREVCLFFCLSVDKADDQIAMLIVRSTLTQCEDAAILHLLHIEWGLRTVNRGTVNRGTIKRGQLIAGQLIAWTHNRSDN